MRKKGPSKTTLKHSLNLCNGYAAGNWANLPCKKSPFYTQHFKGRKERGFREPVGTWGVVLVLVVLGGWSGGWSCTFVSWSGRNWQRVFKMRDLVDLGQGSISVNPGAASSIFKNRGKSQYTERLEPPHPAESYCSRKKIEDKEIDARATRPSRSVIFPLHRAAFFYVVLVEKVEWSWK